MSPYLGGRSGADGDGGDADATGSSRIGLIWAEDSRGVIGSGTAMLWHVPADFAHFKAATIGHPMVMGRSTWESMGSRALPGRTSIVVTRQPDYQAPGAAVAGSLEEGLDAARQAEGSELIWVIGGAQLFEQALGVADLIVQSVLDLDSSHGHDALVYAPAIDPAVWEIDLAASDADWREASGDAPRWKVQAWRRK